MRRCATGLAAGEEYAHRHGALVPVLMSIPTRPSLLAPSAGWYPDPYDRTRLRWWDGYRWTPYVAPYPTPPRRRRSGLPGAIVALGAAALALLLVAGGSLSGAINALPGGSTGWDATTTDVVPPGSPVEAALDSTVVVETPCGPGCVGVGAGVAISEDLILTAAHVVDDASSARILTSDGRSQRTTVVARDDRRDLALLQTSGGHGLAVVQIRDQAAEPGEPAYAIGAPSGSVRLSSGVVTDVLRSPDGVQWVQTSADIDQGNSGGPLLDAQGRLLGIVVTENAEDDTEGWATSAEEIRTFLG